MIAHFPSPFPDELLYSLCARYADRMSYPNVESVNLELFGSRGISAAVDLPSHLSHLQDALPPGHRFTTGRIIDEFTLFPFYAPFLPAGRARRVRHDMAGTDGAAIHKLAGITPSNVRLPNWLRYCPRCVEEDKKVHPECYWHRLHQVPGVEVCPTHNLFLENSAAPARNRVNSAVYTRAEEAVFHTNPRPANPADPHHDLLLRVAREAARLLSRSCAPVDQERLRDKYISALSAKGYATRETVRAGKLAMAMSQFFPAPSLEALQCSFDPTEPHCWPAQIVKNLRQGKTHHPLRHLLLIQFLGVTAETFLTGLPGRARKTHSEVKPFGDGPWPCLNPVCPHFMRPSIRSVEVARGGCRDGARKGIFTCRCGFSYARKCGDQVPEGRQRYDWIEAPGGVWEDALRELWGDSSLSVRQISVRLGVAHNTAKYHATRLGLGFPRKGPDPKVMRENADTVVRLDRRRRQEAAKSKGFEEVREAKRKEWSAAMNAHHEATRTRLQREIAPKTYHWLLHNDNEWLKANMPPPFKRTGTPRRVDWHERDRQLEADVRLTAERIKAVEGRPSQVTVTAVARYLDKKELLQKKKQLDKLPLTKKALDDVVESQIQFAVRRLGWAAACFREEEKVPARSELALRSCVDYSIWQMPEAAAALDARWRELQDLFA